MDDNPYFSNIPIEIQTQIKRDTDAADWAARKRQEVADAWAETQRRQAEQSVNQYGGMGQQQPSYGGMSRPSPTYNADWRRQERQEVPTYTPLPVSGSPVSEPDQPVPTGTVNGPGGSVPDQPAPTGTVPTGSVPDELAPSIDPNAIRNENFINQDRIAEGERQRAQENLASSYPVFMRRIQAAQEIYDQMSPQERARLKITEPVDLMIRGYPGTEDPNAISKVAQIPGNAVAVALARSTPGERSMGETKPSIGAYLTAKGEGLLEGATGKITPSEQMLVSRMRTRGLLPDGISDVDAANYLRGSGVTPDTSDEMAASILSFADPTGFINPSGAAGVVAGGIKRVERNPKVVATIAKAAGGATEQEITRIGEIKRALEAVGTQVSDDEALNILRGQQAAMKTNIKNVISPDIQPVDTGRQAGERTQAELARRHDISVTASPTEIEQARVLNRAENVDELNQRLGQTTWDELAKQAQSRGPATDAEIQQVLKNPINISEGAVDNVRLVETLIPEKARQYDEAITMYNDARKAGTPPDGLQSLGQTARELQNELAELRIRALESGTRAGTELQVQQKFRALYDPAKPSTVQARIATALKNKVAGTKAKVTAAEVTKQMDDWEKLVTAKPDDKLAQYDWWAKLEAGDVTAMDVLGVYNRASLMSNPSTHMTNTFGTAAQGIYHTTAAVGSDLVTGHGNRALGATYGAWVGANRGLADARDVMLHGVTQSEVGRVLSGGEAKAMGATTARRMQPGVGRTAVVALESAADRPAAAADAFNHSVIRNMELGRVAGEQAVSEGLTAGSKRWRVRTAELMANPTPEMSAQAVRVADDVTYRSDLGNLGQKLGNVRGANVVTRLGSAVLMPFYKTPVNIWTMGLQMTPGIGTAWLAGDVLSGAYKAGAKKGTRALGLRVRDQLVGTAVAVPLYQYAISGNMSAQGPQDPEQRRMLEAEGWQMYSIKIGGKWVQYSNWGPLAIPMAAVAGAAEAVQYKKPTDNLGNVVVDASLRFGQLVKTQSYLQGIGQIMDAMDSGAQGESALKTWAAGLPQRAVPFGSAVSGAARAVDPYERTPDFASPDYAKQRFETRIPGLREQVPAKQDVLGNKVENMSGGVTSFLPVRGREDVQHPVISEYQKYKVDIGQPAVTIENVKLTGEERRLYQRLMGRQLEEKATTLIGSKSYQSAKPETKQKMLQTTMDNSRTVAREEVKRRIGTAEFKRRLKESQAQKSAELVGVQ